jgi:predicted Rossmann fold flavoprotein
MQSAMAVLKIDGKTIGSEKGEILFTDYGLSGPAILKLSRETARTNKDSEIVIDLFYEYSEYELLKLLETRKENIANREKESFLFGLLQNRLARAVLVYAGLDLKGKIAEFTEEELEKLVFSLKNFTFTVTGNTGFINSQATAGGIDTKEIEPATMQSKKINGLYIIGELLDVDGDCGGYNLQWAWSSAFCAAESISGEF